MARPGVKHSGTLCAVDNTGNKAGLGAGAVPCPDGRPRAERTEGRGAGVPGRRSELCSPASRFLGFPQIFTQQGNNSFCLSSNCCSCPSPGGCRRGRPQALRRPSCPPPPWPALVRPDTQSPWWEPLGGTDPTQRGSAKRDPGLSLPTASETWVACPDTGRQLLLGALGQPPSSKRLLPPSLTAWGCGWALGGEEGEQSQRV